MHGLLGPNGAGKTTLLRLVLGLCLPDEGTVRVLGVDPALGIPPGLAGFADRPRFYPYLSGRHNLQLLGDFDGGVTAEQVDRVLDLTGLSRRAGSKVGGWSTGMTQRLGLAAALLREPVVLVLDEPATGLDPAGLRDLRSLIVELAGSGTGVLLSSHDVDDVDALCDEVTVLMQGRVVRAGRVSELRGQAPRCGVFLRTADDDTAQSLAAGGGVEWAPDPRGGAQIRATQRQLDTLVLALADAGVAVREMTPVGSALATLYWQATAPELAPAKSA